MNLSLPPQMRAALGTTARVGRTSWLSPSLLRVHLHGPQLVGWRGLAGDKIKVRVGAVMRSYTPAAVEAAEGRVSIIVHVHSADSAACRWATKLRTGDPVVFFGPVRSMPSPDGNERWAAFYGDETTIGAAEAIAAALPEDAVFVGAIEVAAGDEPAVDAVSLDAVTRGPVRGDALVSHVRELAGIPGDGTIWISGESTSVLAVREALVARDVNTSQMRIKSYWSTRGRAHRKSVELLRLRH